MARRAARTRRALKKDAAYCDLQELYIQAAELTRHLPLRVEDWMNEKTS